MSTSTVSSKGQIVIPAAVRADMGARVGTRVEFVKAEGGWLLRPSTRPVSALKGIVPKPPQVVSVDDMDRSVRAHASKSLIKR